MRVAIVGLGEAGAGLHLPALAGIPSVSVVGACDSDPGRRERAASRWGIPPYADVDVMMANAAADVVIVATPPGTHAEHCLRALANGAHVVCEKPFMASLEEADRVIAAASAARKQIAVNHEFREMPIFRTLIDQIRGGHAGALQFVQVWQLMDMPPWAESGWRGQMAERTLFEAGVHLIDLVLGLFGEKPVSVQASTSPGSGRADRVDALVLATLEFSGGRLAQLIQNRLCKGEPQYFEVRADTDLASYRASFGGRARLSVGLFRSTRPHFRFERGTSGIAWRENGVKRVRIARNPANPNMLGTREVLMDAFAAFRQNEAPRSGSAHARDVLETIVGCYVSARTGERIRLDGSAAHRLSGVRMGAAPSRVRRS